MNKSDLISVRENYIKCIKAELLGPGSEISYPDSEHELISTSPLTRYSMGILYPKDNSINSDSDEVDKSGSEDISIEDEGNIEKGDGLSKTKLNESEEDTSFDSNKDDSSLDEEVSFATQNLPSSMGITFFADGNVDKVACSISFATYRKTVPADRRIKFIPKNPETFVIPNELENLIKLNKETGYLELQNNSGGKLDRKFVSQLKGKITEDGFLDALYKLANQANGYVREPHKVDLTLNFPDGKNYIDNNQNIDSTDLKVTALRRKINGVYSVTIMLVNDSTNRREVNNCYFQNEIEISSEKNDFKFCEYGGISDFSLLDDEEKSLELQYRNKKNYANGLGVATNWTIDANGKGKIFTDFFPVSEVPSMDFRLPENSKVNEEKALSMKYLSDLNKSDKTEKLQQLKPIIDAYYIWINGLEEKKGSINSRFRDIAEKNISECRNAANRMYKGLEILETNENAWTSFELANKAMFMQRAQLKIQADTANIDRYPDDKELVNLIKNVDYNTIDTDPKYNKVSKEPYAWRPFQIAFLLMSIASITDEKSTDRDLVDLIWFPTGGGKTEAYLGLTAFTIFYRRLTHLPNSSGTTVIMRYTLRLLAAQQFTRAATLICACEYIRKKNPKILGNDNNPITIGLWIGGEHTPNSNTNAKAHLSNLFKANAASLKNIKEKHNKFQVLKCPWCGTKMVKEAVDKKLVGAWGYVMEDGSKFRLRCPQSACFFSEEEENLPIQIVDEELYKNPPTLLFGTVDKFAMMPWNEKTGSFFGLKSDRRAPELIIQDELHLISGPLGTMVGLFETALDIICKEKGSKFKVVASTATIRRAKEQCGALYNRNVAQFPPPGLDSEDSFFARESEINYEKGSFGRKYVGIMPSGKTKAMMEIRSIAAMLQTIKTMDLPDEIKDKFWTLTVYFNSLKDLGKCTTLVEDDVKDFIKRMVFRTGIAKDARTITSADELTSRVSTTDLNETLDKLEKTEYSKENIENKKYASNIVLATNMISVGIDISRLNVMLMVGQPKLTSEYIQASSRVGRKWPGVVFTLYDGSKSRDRSHYEQFKSYHESFYKYVEPTGATPFSKPARDRALHAVVITLLRLLEPNLSGENDACNFTREKYAKRIESIKNQIVEWDKEVMKKIYKTIEDDSSETANEIDNMLQIWESRAKKYKEANKNFYYGGGKLMFAKPGENEGRLMKGFNTAPDDEAFDTMTSMRNVDTSVKGTVLIWKEK